MTYQLTLSGNCVIRTADMAFIPTDEDNVDYKEYLLWLEEGNEPLQADTPPEDKTLTIEQKLEAIGVSMEELKSVLGLE